VLDNNENTASARQLVFDLKHRCAMGREDFLITSSNREAVEAIDAWPDWQHHTLALVGPSASGKTAVPGEAAPCISTKTMPPR